MNKKHDTIATRIAIILIKFNNGEKLRVDELAEEFGVTTRTIQRDLNNRLIGVPIKKEGKYYFLEPKYLGRFVLDDLNSFTHLIGLNKMFPSFDKLFLTHLLDKSVAHAYLIKTHNFEDISDKIDKFKLIESAIINFNILELTYRNQKRRVYPYKLANVKGIWYLVALQDNIIKTFTFTKISYLKITNSGFSVDKDILKKIEDNDTLWFSNNKIKVILKVNASISQYFKRRKILPYQKIIKTFDNGDLIILTKITFEKEIIQMVQYWLPDILIISPKYLKNKLEDNIIKSLKLYKQKYFF